MNNNLNSKVNKTATQWKVRAKEDRASRPNIIRAQEFALDLLDYMESQNMKQVELAERMDVSLQQVNEILRAKTNLTFEILDKIAAALGVSISSPRIEVRSEIFSKSVGTSTQTVPRQRPKEIHENLSSPMVAMEIPYQV